MSDLSNKKILMVVAFENFRDEEYLTPKEIFEDAGAEVVTASTQEGEASGMLGAKTEVDVTLDEVDVMEYDAIVIAGGTGATVYWDDDLLHEILRMAVEVDKLVAAICLSPVTLGKAGLLKGKRVTCYIDAKDKLMKSGISEYVDEPVVVDGKIVTGNGPQAAEEFGQTVASMLA